MKQRTKDALTICGVSWLVSAVLLLADKLVLYFLLHQASSSAFDMGVGLIILTAASCLWTLFITAAYILDAIEKRTRT